MNLNVKQTFLIICESGGYNSGCVLGAHQAHAVKVKTSL